jgi:hypothetical protein
VGTVVHRFQPARHKAAANLNLVERWRRRTHRDVVQFNLIVTQEESPNQPFWCNGFIPK